MRDNRGPGRGVARGISERFGLDAVTDAPLPELLSDMGNYSAGELVGAFVAWMTSRAMSPDTIKRRRLSVSQFARSIAPVQLAAVEPADIEDWLTTKTAPRTRHAYRSDLAAFYSWGVRRRLFEQNPVEQTDSIRVPKSLPRPIPATPEQLHELIASAPTHVRVALVLAVYSGLRRAEITRLTTADVVLDSSEPVLYVRQGKGRKDRAVPAHPTVVAELRRVGGSHGQRFVPVSPDWLGTAGRRLLRTHGFDATLHQGRHSFGTELARVTGGDLMLIQQLMGHEHTSTTTGYIALNAPGGTDVAAMYTSSPGQLERTRRQIRARRRARRPPPKTTNDPRAVARGSS